MAQTARTRGGETRNGVAKIREERERANVGAPRAPVLGDERGALLQEASRWIEVNAGRVWISP